MGEGKSMSKSETVRTADSKFSVDTSHNFIDPDESIDAYG